jgi:hypothetical protein
MCVELLTELYTVVGVLFCLFMTDRSEDRWRSQLGDGYLRANTSKGVVALLRCFLFNKHMCVELLTELYTVVGVLFCLFMTDRSEDRLQRYRMEASTDVGVQPGLLLLSFSSFHKVSK